MGGVFEEDFTNGTAKDIVDGRKLYRRLAVSIVTEEKMGWLRPVERYWPPREMGDRGRGRRPE